MNFDSVKHRRNTDATSSSASLSTRWYDTALFITLMMLETSLPAQGQRILSADTTYNLFQRTQVPTKLDTKHKEYTMSDRSDVHLSAYAPRQRASTCTRTHTHMICTYVRQTGIAIILEPKVMIRFGYLMEPSAGPLMLCIEFSTNACSPFPSSW